uniref:CMP/dCMP-type deaminase domain-containing protein n=1 Tax=Steinernema glaseri TaxID=37863 RepID=A0A1I7XXI8_9BILA
MSLEATSLAFLEEAFRLAEEALDSNEVPVGCVFVYRGEIVGRGRNDVNRTKNPTRHAEMVAFDELREWCSKTGRSLEEVLAETELYVSLEPCIMCGCAMYQLKIKKIVYGAGNERFGGIDSVAGKEKYAVEHDIENPTVDVQWNNTPAPRLLLPMAPSPARVVCLSPQVSFQGKDRTSRGEELARASRSRRWRRLTRRLPGGLAPLFLFGARIIVQMLFSLCFGRVLSPLPKSGVLRPENALLHHMGSVHEGLQTGAVMVIRAGQDCRQGELAFLTVAGSTCRPTALCFAETGVSACRVSAV